MLAVESSAAKSIITASPQISLSTAIKLMVTPGSRDNIMESERQGFLTEGISTLSLSKHLFILEEETEFTTGKKRLIGIFSCTDIPNIIEQQVDLSTVPIREFMHYPPYHLKPGFDITEAWQLMQQQSLQVLPIIAESGDFLGVLTLEMVVSQISRKLEETEAKLQTEIDSKQNHQDLQVKNEELTKINKQLQHAICDRIATEAQLLQTTSELQEIFHAFPDNYFRVASDGTILSYHTRNNTALSLPPEEFLNRKMQDVLPAEVGIQFQTAIFQLNTGIPSITLEYQLPMPEGEQWFEARMFPSIQNQIIAIVRDITESKLTQNALQESYLDLESRVEVRTQDLKNTNERLLQEIIERQRIEEELRYQNEFKKIISTISTHLINLASSQINLEINNALAKISEFLKVDRSYIFIFAENSLELQGKYEWSAFEIPFIPFSEETVTATVINFIVRKIQQTEIIYIPNISELPLEENFYKQILISHKVQSQIILPIICAGQQIGYLGFDVIRAHKSWSNETITLLKMVAEIFGHTLERQRVEQALNTSNERYTRAINAGKVGIWEWDIETNEIYIDPNLKNMLGYADSEISNNFNDWLNYIHPHDITAYKLEINAYLEGLTNKCECEHRMRAKDGHYMWFLARGTVLRSEDGQPQLIAGSNTDITEKKEAELKLKASLQEKEVLLKEIHHRVKNNLQVISSLLRLQARYIQDQQTLEFFRDSQNRVRAMAMIHENLYHSNDLASINFSNYTRNLMQNMIRCYGIQKNIQIHQNIDNVSLRIDTAIPCGLIINELVSNAIKHAFPDQDEGHIYIDFFDLGQGKYSFTVSDNGIGLVITQDDKQVKSLGLQLVWNLVEQLEGSIISNPKCGTSFTVNFTEIR